MKKCERIKTKCDVCDKEIELTPYRFNRTKHHYCSKECTYKAKERKVKVKCEECGKEFELTEYRANKNRMHFCCSECQTKYNYKNTHEIRKCEFCGKEFECTQSSTQRFCSNECVNKWQVGRLTGENHPTYSQVSVKCDTCGKEFKTKKHKAESNKHNFCCRECVRKWFSEVYSKQDFVREAMRKRALNMLENGVINTNSKPQIITNKILEELGIKYQNEKVFDFYAVDNYLLEQNLIIEVMGDYWHTSPLKYSSPKNDNAKKVIRKDKAKNTYFINQHNIHILYLWEKDLYNNPLLCKKLIELYISNNGILENYNSFNYILENEEIKLKEFITLSFQEK